MTLRASWGYSVSLLWIIILYPAGNRTTQDSVRPWVQAKYIVNRAFGLFTIWTSPLQDTNKPLRRLIYLVPKRACWDLYRYFLVIAELYYTDIDFQLIVTMLWKWVAWPRLCFEVRLKHHNITFDDPSHQWFRKAFPFTSKLKSNSTEIWYLWRQRSGSGSTSFQPNLTPEH